jgi:hypothetical protein
MLQCQLRLGGWQPVPLDDFADRKALARYAEGNVRAMSRSCSAASD